MDRPSAILMSIHPRHAKAIINGDKTAEFRRVKPKLKSGDLVVIYETSPIMAVTSIFSVKQVLWLPIDKLWGKTKSLAAISEKEFFDYFAGNTDGCAIIINKVWVLDTKKALSELSSAEKVIKPPQSYIYLPYDNLEEIAGSNL